MPRKGENIYKRKDGRWEGRYIKGRRTDGRAIYGSVYARKYSEVRERLLLLKAEYASWEHKETGFTGSVWDWLSYWLEYLERPHVKHSTYASYRCKLECHVLPVLGGKKLAKLKESDIQNWLDQMIAKGLAANTIRTVFRILSTSLGKAVSRHCLFANPCREAVLPEVKKPGIRALTFAQQKKLEKQALFEKGNEAVILALYTGMRIGEISALTWGDVDFENNLIHVRRTLQRITDYESSGVKTRVIMDIPKSDTSCRIIPFAAHLKELLLKWKAVSDSAYVVSCRGDYAEPRVLSYRFHQTAERAGLEAVTFHGLRHTYATRCVERGIDIVTLSRLLGHASAKMTLDIYADSTMEQRRAAMGVLDLLLTKNSSQATDTGMLLKGWGKIADLIMQTAARDLPAVY